MPTKFVGSAKTGRTNRRIARVRLANPKALPNVKADNKYTPREVRRVRKVAGRVDRRAATKQKRTAKTPYNPLAPLTGPREKAETKAATQLQFGDQAAALAKEIRGNTQTQANTASYYDDYLDKLREATANVKAADAENAAAEQQRVDSSYAQDSAGVAARDAAASEQAAKLGRGPVQSQEGAQAVAAQRSQGNQSLARTRSQGAADTRYMELRGATSVQAKAEAEGRLSAKAADLRRQKTQLAKDKGAFKVNLRAKNRESERSWAAVKKEFKVKDEANAIDRMTARTAAKSKTQSLNAQKIVARIYASADKSKARAQIRVAKLQLKKGKIDQHQYRKIVNIYHGLPKKGVSGGAAPSGKNGKASKPGVGSGPNGTLAPWEKDKVSGAVRQFGNANLGTGDRNRAIDTAVKNGVPARLARIAWRQYIKHHAPNKPRGGSSPTGPMGTGKT